MSLRFSIFLLLKASDVSIVQKGGNFSGCGICYLFSGLLSMLPEGSGGVCLILVYLICAEAFQFNFNLIRSPVLECPGVFI